MYNNVPYSNDKKVFLGALALDGIFRKRDVKISTISQGESVSLSVSRGDSDGCAIL